MQRLLTEPFEVSDEDGIPDSAFERQPHLVARGTREARERLALADRRLEHQVHTLT